MLILHYRAPRYCFQPDISADTSISAEYIFLFAARFSAATPDVTEATPRAEIFRWPLASRYFQAGFLSAIRLASFFLL
jgi:hypothetical protein